MLTLGKIGQTRYFRSMEGYFITFVFTCQFLFPNFTRNFSGYFLLPKTGDCSAVPGSGKITELSNRQINILDFLVYQFSLFILNDEFFVKYDFGYDGRP